MVLLIGMLFEKIQIEIKVWCFSGFVLKKMEEKQLTMGPIQHVQQQQYRQQLKQNVTLMSKLNS
jgi:hypothetical protein